MYTRPESSGGSGSATRGGAAVGVLGGAGVIVLGGAAVGLVGRDVGKLGSVGDSGLVTAVPEVPDWQPAINEPAARRHARASFVLVDARTRPTVRNMWRELLE